MEIIKDKIELKILKQIAAGRFGDMVKGVVDVDREILALDAELHSDLEALLLEKGSKQRNLWGINLYPDIPGEEFLEYDSMINLRPGQGNRSRSVDDAEIRKKILSIVEKRVAR